LIPQDIDAVDGRHAVEVIGVPPLGLLDSRDHNSYLYGLLNVEVGVDHDHNV